MVSLLDETLQPDQEEAEKGGQHSPGGDRK
jgi:hypothetical protein